jgi:hypothetical protein
MIVQAGSRGRLLALLPVEGLGDEVVVILEHLQPATTSAKSRKSWVVNTVRCTIEKQISTWLSQDGVFMVAWQKIALGRVHAGKTVTIHVKSTTST